MNDKSDDIRVNSVKESTELGYELIK